MLDLDRRDALASVVTTLSLRCWSNEHLDTDLRDAFAGCLRVLGATAVIVHFDRENVTIAYALRRADELHLANEARGRFLDLRVDEPIVSRLHNLHVVGSWIFENSRPLGKPNAEGADRQRTAMGYAVLCFDALPDSPVDRDRFITFHSRACAGMFFQVLQLRARLFLPFAPRMAESYWNESGEDPATAKLTPPWDPTKQPLRTATLGFDLRKSTFCMENADNPKAFAEWLDQLVQILMNVSHLYGGVFDKFTGDGVLVHFLSDACKIIYGRKAVTAAVLCAVAMQHATRQHLGRLRKMLRLNSHVVGGAIGVDVAYAHWSLDHRHNPITVGRGVVNACRLMDSTRAGGIRLTNIAYQRLLDPQLQQLFVEVPFTSKEFDDEKKITAWELQQTLAPIADIQQQQIRDICTAAWEQSTIALDA